MTADYTKITALRYSAAPSWLTDHYYVACRFCDVMQMQAYLRTGVDPGPLSPQFMTICAAEWDGPGGTNIGHGWSSPLLGWGIAEKYGACRSTTCPQKARKLTDAMKSEAAQFRVGSQFLLLKDIPDYPAAVAHLAANHGDGFVLSNAGRKSYAIIGVDAQGRGIWLDGSGTTPPKVVAKSEADGIAAWRSMLYDQRNRGGTYPPEQFMVGLTMRGEA